MPEFEIFKGNNKKILKMFRRDNVLVVFFILTAVVIGLCIAATIMFYSNQQEANTIQSGVFIKNINVSGLTKEEAITLVNNELNNLMNDHIELVYKNNVYYLEVEQIEAKFDVESSVSFALDIAKSGNFIQDINQYINVLMGNINIEPNLIYNDELLTEYITHIEKNLPDQLQQADYYVEDDELIITNGVNGAGIEYEKLKEDLISAIQDISFSKRYISIPTYVQYPDPINLDTIHEEIYCAPENAYFTTEPYAVYADVTGIDFNIDMIRNEIEQNPEAEEYKTDLIYTKPEITVDDLGKDAFPDLLGSFSTNYATSNTDRTTNLRLASNKIDGKVIMPGDEFSYNRVVGKRTIAAGYKEAAIYQDGQVTNGLGGGICQISTTLYNAAIEANMEITSRRNHMFVPSYSDAGKDATVVWGSTDFKFKNTREYPIKIESSVSGGVAKINIYGLKTDDEYDISIETQTIKNTSSSLVVDSYKVYRKDGIIVQSEKLDRDKYKKH